MIPEIQVLHNNFEGKKWNTNTQVEFIKSLLKEVILMVKAQKKIWHLVQETELIGHRKR